MTPFFRKILVSVKFVSAILGSEMAAPTLWTPGKNAFFLQENLLFFHRIPRFWGGGGFWVWGGGFWVGGGGGGADFIFMGAGIFLINSEDRGLKVRFSLATIAFDRDSAQMS